MSLKTQVGRTVIFVFGGPLLFEILIETIGERKCRKALGVGEPLTVTCGQRIRPLQERQILGTVALIAIQVSERRMVRHGR